MGKLLIVFVVLIGFLIFTPVPQAGKRNDTTDTGLLFPCAAGDVTVSEAVLWVRTSGPGKVSMQFGGDATLSEYTETPAVDVTEKTDFTAKFGIEGLKPHKKYYYRGSVMGKAPGPTCRFVTAPLPNNVRDVRFAFGGDTAAPYQPFAIMDAIRKVRPDFFVFLGDTIYADHGRPATDLEGFWGKYARNRRDLATQRLLGDTSIYVAWDDHEVRDNYYGEDALALLGWKAFLNYWPVREDAAQPFRIYRSFRWGKAVELFILDTRQYRDPVKRTMLGQAQKTWLLKSLAASSAWFKFIATSVPFSSPRADKWGDFQEERQEIMTFISEKQVHGVIFLAADVHYAAVARVANSPVLKEIITGPLAQRTNQGVLGTDDRFEFFFNDEVNYGLVKIKGLAEKPYAEIDILDDKNRLLHRITMDASGRPEQVTSGTGPPA